VCLPLRDRFPRLFSCSSHHGATIDYVLMQSNTGGVHEWNITFVLDFNDWVVDVVVAFFQFLSSNTSNREGPDGLRWKLQKNVIFYSCSFCYALKDRHGVQFPGKTVHHLLLHCCVVSELWSFVL
jgi:hypothetical protein